MKMDSLKPRVSVPTCVSQLRTKKTKKKHFISKAVRQNLGFEARRWSPTLQEEALVQWLQQLKNV